MRSLPGKNGVSATKTAQAGGVVRMNRVILLCAIGSLPQFVAMIVDLDFNLVNFLLTASMSQNICLLLRAYAYE